MPATLDDLKTLARNLRIHSIRSTTAAASGHPTTCLSSAEIVAVLFGSVMRYDPKNVNHPNNDRFILSKGHAAPVLYGAWAEAGIISREAVMTLRKIDSDLEGHPTFRLPWAVAATGSLGQGLSVGAGLALNAKKLDKLPCRTFVLMGDGECAEGSVWEAAVFAGHYKLDNLVGIVDLNGLGQSEKTMYGTDPEPFALRFRSCGWETAVVDGHDLSALLAVFEKAAKTSGKPFAIIAKTKKGKGVSFLEDKGGWHGKPLKKDEEAKALAELGNELSASPVIRVAAPAPAGASAPRIVPDLPTPTAKIGDKIATRVAYGDALAKLGAVHPGVVALDGDTKNSTFAEKFMKAFPDRYFEAFIAEQNMVSVAVGLAARGKIPFVSTFAAFFARAYDQIRMAGLSAANIKICGSHCGVSIGEDGPSQMGLEDIAMMRAIPRGILLYPSDAVSTEKLVVEMARFKGIAYLRTTRLPMPVIYPTHEKFPVGGSKVVRSSPKDKLAIVAAGITIHEALAAADDLAKDGIAVRVIDAYSVKPMDREGLLKAARETGGRLLTVEDHYPEGGLGDAVLGALATEGVRVFKMAVPDLPRSGKPDELLRAFGIDRTHIAAKARAIIG
ncbi:MAG: transketolase [Planctomycetota bacterium]